jgi:hypothetical protein
MICDRHPRQLGFALPMLDKRRHERRIAQQLVQPGEILNIIRSSRQKQAHMQAYSE